MKKRIVLHIGDSKTGTSIIQNFLDVNRLRLFKVHGLLYPNFSESQLEMGRYHNHIPWYLDAIKNDGTKFMSDMRYLIDYSQKANINKIIMSSEAWLEHKKTVKMFGKFLGEFGNIDLHIICYLRRVDKWAESAWKQWGLKMHDNLEDYLNQNNIKSRFETLYNNLVNWKDLIGRDNIIVRPYEKGQLPMGLIPDFLANIGINYEDNEWEKTDNSNLAQNYGFNRDVVEILHICRDLFENPHDNSLFNLFSELLNDKFQKKPFEPYSLLTPQQRLMLIENNQAYVKKIAREFMNRSDGKIFYDSIPDEGEEHQAYERMNFETALPVIIELIKQEHEFAKRINRRISHQNHRISELENDLRGNYQRKLSFHNLYDYFKGKIKKILHLRK